MTNTGVQIGIFEALGATPAALAHHSLLIGADGHALSKRLGTLSVETFRADGLEPMAILSHAALVGTSDAIEPHQTIDELAALFDLGKISMAPGRFDVEDLKGLNAKLLHKLPYEAVAERLAALGISGGQPFWEAVRGNITLLRDAADWWRVAAGEIDPVIEDANVTSTAGGPAARWLVGRKHVERAHRRRLEGDRTQGSGPFPSASPGTHGPRRRAQSSGCCCPDRARARASAARSAGAAKSPNDGNG